MQNSGAKRLNSICHLLALLGAHPIFRISRIRVNEIKKALKRQQLILIQ
jgi:hypothetical protein